MKPSTVSAREAPTPIAAPQTTSLWMTTDAPLLAPLESDLHADVCVIGAGIAGLSIAYILQRKGKSVIVLDDGPVGGGETARTTAHLSNLLDTRYTELESLHGVERTRLVAESHTHAIDAIETIVEREKIACDFRRVDGFLFSATGDPNELEPERAAAVRAGLASVTWIDRAPLLAFDTQRCLRFPKQAQFHPLRYLAGLAAVITREGGRIVSAHATRINGSPTACVETESGHIVTAESVVVATNTPVNDRITIHTKQAAYRSYVIAARVPKGTVPAALYWDTADPYHYVRTQPDDERHDYLIVGGEDHHTGQADDAPERFASLEEWARQRFEPLGPVVHRWSGQIVAAIDGLGFIGRNPGDVGNVFVATGDSGNGMTHGTIAGILISDLIVGRANPWTTLYEPGRITPGAAFTFTKESLHVAAGYARWITSGHPNSVEHLAAGCGTVIQRGLRKIAVYRDPNGVLCERSAICPHLGGIVAWNDGEKSWDCPCHGSRFDATGRVINGPANSDLAEPS